jgi:hypothetical protein
LLTTSYLTYLLPTACEVPSVHIEHLEIPSKLNPIGVRGARELGTIGAPAAVANAIEECPFKLWRPDPGVPPDSGPDLAARFGCNFVTLRHRCMMR